MVTSTHDQQTLLALKHILCERLQSLVHAQHLSDLLRNIVKAVDDLLPSSSLSDRVVGELNSHHDERNVLRSVSLGGGDTDLGSGVDVHTTVGLSGKSGLQSQRERRTNNKQFTPTVLTTPKLRAPRSRQYRMAKIVSAVSPDCETKMATSSRNTGVRRSRKSEASGQLQPRPDEMRQLTQFNGYGNIRQLLEHWSHSDTRVVRGSTGDKEESSTPSNDRQVRLETTESDRVSVKVDSTSHSVDDRFGLLVNLFLHEMVVLTLHDLGELNLESLDGSDG